MDRNLVYPGSIPLDTDVLNLNRSTMVAIGYLAQATLGTTTVVDGLSLHPDGAGVHDHFSRPGKYHAVWFCRSARIRLTPCG